MSSGKEGKIPSLCQELMKALEVWDIIEPTTEVKTPKPETKKEESSQKNQLFTSIKNQLDKLSL